MFIIQQSKFVLKSLLLVAALTLLVAFILNASRPGRAVEGCPEGCATEIIRRVGPLRVISLNMLHGFPEFEDLSLRLDLIAGEIRRLDADVVLLQEVPWTRRMGNGADYLAQELGYNYLYYRANGNRSLIFFEEGEAILSRFRLEDSFFTVLQPEVGLFERRVSLGASTETPMGEVTFIVTHLTDKDPQANYKQVESLRGVVEAHDGGLTIVAGDFNASPGDPQITELDSLWIDAYRAIHPIDPGYTCCIDDLALNQAKPLEKRIDYIFLVSKNGESGQIVSAQRVFNRPFPVGDRWQWASDHSGLMVEIVP
jgi:endonuclease/exonuclease/phosphatase family metal-dependent hydrolase